VGKKALLPQIYRNECSRFMFLITVNKVTFSVAGFANLSGGKTHADRSLAHHFFQVGFHCHKAVSSRYQLQAAIISPQEELRVSVSSA